MGRRTVMSDFYGMKPGNVPGFAEAGDGRFIGVQGLPEQTVQLAFEVCVRHVATVIEDKRREEGKADPRGDLTP
jgi:hypothetical protein